MSEQQRRLYSVSVSIEFDMCVYAESAEDAERIAGEDWHEELNLNQAPYFSASQVGAWEAKRRAQELPWGETNSKVWDLWLEQEERRKEEEARAELDRRQARLFAEDGAS